MQVDVSPLVSIVTPSFNQAAFLEQTLSSVFDQDYSPIEYLVLDGGSRDGSVEILRRHATRLAYWHSRPDKGFGDAIAQGFALSQGSILAYLNSDDLLAPDAVGHAVRTLQRLPDVAMVYGNRVCINVEGQVLYRRPSLPWLARSAFAGLIIPQETCFWRRDVYQAVGGMNSELRFAIDYDLFSRFAQTGRIIHQRKIWGFFRKHPASKTMTQFRTLGLAEGARVQREVWGAEVSAWRWQIMTFLVRAYALSTSSRRAPARWPSALPPPRPVPLLRRIRDAVHEDSPLNRWLQRTKPTR